MRRTVPPLIASVVVAVLLAVTQTHAGAQRRPQTARPCPQVIPDGDVCTAFGRGRACRYGHGTSCICQRRSATERVLHWYCAGR